jgi:hypothetical protein
MRHLIGSILAITIAGVAAVAATTALLNTPTRGPAAGAASTNTQPGQALAQAAEIPDAPAPKGTNAPEAPATSGAGSTAGEPAAAKPAAEGEGTEESDEDPYEGIAPEDLPPDLQYDADASVSFPTNT